MPSKCKPNSLAWKSVLFIRCPCVSTPTGQHPKLGPHVLPLNNGRLLSATLLPPAEHLLFLKNIWNVYAGMVLVLYTYVIISNPPNDPVVLAEFAEAHAGNEELNRDSNLPDPSARSLCMKVPHWRIALPCLLSRASPVPLACLLLQQPARAFL